MNVKMISIAKDYSDEPGGRYYTDGPHSGQRFREEFLAPALRNNEVVEVDIGDVLAFGSSFLEEAFGGLVRLGFAARDLHNRLRVVSGSPTHQKRIWRYIDDAGAVVA
ncbi:STAS-like domain-containing protein [Burkholderia guangdongensis]|uniref:STAS-like domain-containing protein n=1 Tax=Burkholderia guangdongensis TaxID=1792500 RepID=UPI001FE8D5B1|nr:STAS-like domain-containing protein [Burkholderia guangdongensis]